MVSSALPRSFMYNDSIDDYVNYFYSNTYSEIGFVESVSEFGRTYRKFNYSSIGIGKNIKFKTSYDEGNVAFILGLNFDDVGQNSILTSDRTGLYLFKIFTQGDVSYYFGAEILNTKLSMGSVNNVIRMSLELNIITTMCIESFKEPEAEERDYMFIIPTEGQTLTISSGTNALVLSPAAPLNILNIIMPPDPLDGQVFEVSTGFGINILAVTGPDSEVIFGESESLPDNRGIAWRYISSEDTWFRRY